MSLRRQQLRAAFILNIARFVQWQNHSKTHPSTKFVLCLYQYNSLQSGIDTIIGKTVNNRILEAVTINTMNQIDSCDGILVDHRSLAEYQQAIETNYPTDILTILDHTGAASNQRAHSGIVISLVRRGAGIGLEINRATARSHHLSFSSDILRVSTLVGGK